MSTFTESRTSDIKLFTLVSDCAQVCFSSLGIGRCQLISHSSHLCSDVFLSFFDMTNVSGSGDSGSSYLPCAAPPNGPACTGCCPGGGRGVLLSSAANSIASRLVTPLERTSGADRSW